MDNFERAIRAAAFHYVVGGVRDAEILAKWAGISPRSLYRVLREEGHRLHAVWHSELDALGYEGERNFRVKPRGRQVCPEKREQARASWNSLKALYPGISRNNLAEKLAVTLGETHGAVVGWIRAFEKEEDNE